MAQKIQVRRGTNAQRLTITPDVGEPCFTTDTKQAFIGDGVTPGGNPLGNFITQAGKTAIGSGVGFVDVTFPTTFGSLLWHFLGMPMITNNVDASPLNLHSTFMKSRTATGCRVYFNGDTDSVNYVLEWEAKLD